MHELVLDFIDHVVGPFAVLSSAQIDTTDLQAAVKAALAYFDKRGDAAAKAVAALVVSKIDRPLYFDTPEFSYEMIRAIEGCDATGLHDEQ